MLSCSFCFYKTAKPFQCVFSYRSKWNLYFSNYKRSISRFKSILSKMRLWILPKISSGCVLESARLILSGWKTCAISVLIIIRVLERFRKHFWRIFVSKRFDAGKILFILARYISKNVSWLTELNSQRDALKSVRNMYLHVKVCRVATGSNLSGFFCSNCSFTGTVLELRKNKLAFERMLQEELSVKVVLKSSLWGKISQLTVSSAVRMFYLAVFHLLGNNCTTKIYCILRAN